MTDKDAAQEVNNTVESIYRGESRRVLATLIRLLGDFDVAEEALHDAFHAACEQWPREGIPANPRAWLVSCGRFQAIDRLRRLRRFDALDDVAELAESVADESACDEQENIEDDRLRLIFTCCHPALSPDAQIALTLREVCGLGTEEIAHAFLIPAPTLAQRIVRAKSKIREAHIPYEVPDKNELPQRLNAVLRVIYLVFNEGYFASAGSELTRTNLSSEAIRLGRLLLELQPESETMGLLALMLLTEARRAARQTEAGEILLLDEQDRTLWNREQIAEGLALVERALRTGRFATYSLQAAIAAIHAEAPSTVATDWEQIVGLYDVMMKIEPSAVVELNRAVAVAMRDGAAEGLVLIDAILKRGDLIDYHFAYSAKAELCRRLGDLKEARLAYERALRLSPPAPAQRFLHLKLSELDGCQRRTY
jgi:RNA polymerase sigma-70 factor (ECF subfamily)